MIDIPTSGCVRALDRHRTIGAQDVGSQSLGEPACPVCSASSLEEDRLPRPRLIELYRQLGGVSSQQEDLFGDYRLMRCSACDLRFADPMRAGSEAFYDWAYRQAPYETDARWEWDAIVWHLRHCPDGPVLDIGCGKGQLLHQIALVTGRRVVGIERNEAGLEVCRNIGVPVEKGDLAHLIADARHVAAYAAVCLSHVIEHLEQPVMVLRQAASLLKPHGRLYVAVPFSPQFWEGDGYDPLNLPPHHLTRWNPRSMLALAAKAGLAVEMQSAPPVSVWRIIWVMLAKHFGTVDARRRLKWRALFSHPFESVGVAMRELRRPRQTFAGRRAGHILLAIFSAPATSGN